MTQVHSCLVTRITCLSLTLLAMGCLTSLPGFAVAATDPLKIPVTKGWWIPKLNNKVNFHRDSDVEASTLSVPVPQPKPETDCFLQVEGTSLQCDSKPSYFFRRQRCFRGVALSIEHPTVHTVYLEHYYTRSGRPWNAAIAICDGRGTRMRKFGDKLYIWSKKPVAEYDNKHLAYEFTLGGNRWVVPVHWHTDGRIKYAKIHFSTRETHQNFVLRPSVQGFLEPIPDDDLEAYENRPNLVFSSNGNTYRHAYAVGDNDTFLKKEYAIMARIYCDAGENIFSAVDKDFGDTFSFGKRTAAEHEALLDASQRVVVLPQLAFPA